VEKQMRKDIDKLEGQRDQLMQALERAQQENFDLLMEHGQMPDPRDKQ
jgi:hypothetical protein